MNKIIYTLLFVTFFFVSSKCDEVEDEYLGPLYNYAAEICENSSGDPEFYRKFGDSIKKSMICYEDTLNSTAMYIESQELRPLGRINELYNKTCQKQDAIVQCFTSESETYNTCFTEEQILKKDLMIRTIKRMMSYACGTDGDTIALFVDKLGPECFDQQQSSARKCFKVFQKYTDLNPFSPSTFINDDTCGDLKNLRNCLIPSLKKCPHLEVANIVDGFIDVTLDQLSCQTD